MKMTNLPEVLRILRKNGWGKYLLYNSVDHYYCLIGALNKAAFANPNHTALYDRPGTVPNARRDFMQLADTIMDCYPERIQDAREKDGTWGIIQAFTNHYQTKFPDVESVVEMSIMVVSEAF